MPALVPARKPIPSVCAERMAGNASIDSPRTHIESGVRSIQSKAISTGVMRRSAHQAEDSSLHDECEEPMAAVDHAEHRLALLKGVVDGNRGNDEAQPHQRA